MRLTSSRVMTGLSRASRSSSVSGALDFLTSATEGLAPRRSHETKANKVDATRMRGRALTGLALHFRDFGPSSRNRFRRRAVCHWRPERLQQQEPRAEDQAAVGDVEDGPFEPVEVHPVTDAVENDAVEEVPNRAAEDESEGGAEWAVLGGRGPRAPVDDCPAAMKLTTAKNVLAYT